MGGFGIRLPGISRLLAQAFHRANMVRLGRVVVRLVEARLVALALPGQLLDS